MAESIKASYWEKDSFLKTYDLIVVGAGIVGLSSAIFYKRAHPSARVLVVDKGLMPEGASTRNAGFACVGSITEHLADIDKESEEIVKKRIVTRYEGLQLLRSLLGDEALNYEACGGYELFTDTERFREASGHIERFNGWLSRLLGEDQVYTATEMNGYPVIENRLEGALHPGKMMQEFVDIAGREGLRVLWNTKVEAVESSGTVQLSSGKALEAEQVLLASNGFTKELFPEAGIQPARGYVMVTNPQQSMPWQGTFHHDRGYVYFRNVHNRLLIGGARNIAYDDEQTSAFGTNQTIKDYLADFVTTTLKLSPGWEVEYEWSGIMGFTETKTPEVKKLDGKRVVAAGLSGMGVAIGAAIGKQTASLLSK